MGYLSPCPPFTTVASGIMALATLVSLWCDLGLWFVGHVERAAQLIEQSGYHRRDKELRALQEVLENSAA